VTVLCGLAVACAVRCASREYVFGVAGQILDARGQPVPGARVTLTTERPVYDGATPLRSTAIETDAIAWFSFTFTTRHAATAYVVLVEKPGCTSQKVSSVGPPSQEHFIVLDCRADAGAP
jgi:hypothetical protein